MSMGQPPKTPSHLLAGDAAAVAELIDRTYHGINRAVAAGLGRAGYRDIRPSHGAVFELIGDGARVSDMAQRAGMSKQAMGELVAALEAAGYLKRRPDPSDRRARIAHLTPKGHRAVCAARNVLSEIYRPWQDQPGPAGLSTLRHALEQLSAALP